MRIAVPYDNGQVFLHFGKTKQFKLYEAEGGQILWDMVINTDAEGHDGLAQFLQQAGVKLVLCGGIGGGAIAALQKAGILLQGGIAGDADAKVKEFLNGTLQTAPLKPCHHHDGHGHHEGCGHHDGCGGHEGCESAGECESAGGCGCTH